MSVAYNKEQLINTDCGMHSRFHYRGAHSLNAPRRITGGVGIKQLGCMRVHLCVREPVTKSVFTFTSPERMPAVQ